MNTEFQVLRWGIPGWMFLMTITIFKMSLYKFKVSSFVQAFQNPSALTGIATLFVALGVPIGYIIYHVYFWLKWVGRNKNIEIAIKDLDYFKGKITEHSKEDWALVEERANHLMSVVIMQKEVLYEDIERRYNIYSNRTSRLHGLGASCLAMILGVVTFIILLFSDVTSQYNLVYPLVLGVPFCVAVLIIYLNYLSQNRSGFRQFNSIMRDIEEANEKNEK